MGVVTVMVRTGPIVYCSAQEQYGTGLYWQVRRHSTVSSITVIVHYSDRPLQYVLLNTTVSFQNMIVELG